MWESIWTLGGSLLVVAGRLVEDGELSTSDMAIVDAVTEERHRLDEYARRAVLDDWERGYLLLLDADMIVLERRVEFCRFIIDQCTLRA